MDWMDGSHIHIYYESYVSYTHGVADQWQLDLKGEVKQTDGAAVLRAVVSRIQTKKNLQEQPQSLSNNLTLVAAHVAHETGNRYYWKVNLQKKNTNCTPRLAAGGMRSKKTHPKSIKDRRRKKKMGI